MTIKAKEFDRSPPARDLAKADERRIEEAYRIAQVINAAIPPAQMREAPVAPARGTMRLVDNYAVLPGGLRRLDGAHWVQPTSLEIENTWSRQRAGAAAVDRVEDRAAAKGREATDAERETALRGVDLFNPAQVAMAERYRALTEWRAGSAIKCASLEAGRGGASGKDFMDSFLDAGAELDRLHAAIGPGMCLTPRRNMDRGNGRDPLSTRQAVDGVILRGMTISALLKRHGWATKGQTRKVVRDAIRGALDRMQGYGS